MEEGAPFSSWGRGGMGLSLAVVKGASPWAQPGVTGRGGAGQSPGGCSRALSLCRSEYLTMLMPPSQEEEK